MKKAKIIQHIALVGHTSDAVNLNKLMKRMGLTNRSAVIRTLIDYAYHSDDTFISAIKCRVHEDNGRHTR